MAYSRSLVLSLVFYITLILPRAVQGHSDKDSNNERRGLDWTKASPNDNFNPGDNLVAEWTGKHAVEFPSVSCPQDEDEVVESGCGGVVWPEAAGDGDSYSFTLEIPDKETSSTFYIRMKGYLGNTMQSPSLSFDPSSQNDGSVETIYDRDGPSAPSTSRSDALDEDSPSSQDADDDPDSLEGSSPQAPLNKPGADKSPTPSSGSMSDSDRKELQTTPGYVAGTTVSDNSRTKATYSSVVSHSSKSESHASPTATAGISSSPNLKSDGNNDNGVLSPQDATLRRASVPIAAIAVPFSLVGATILISFFLFFMRRRSLAAHNAQIIDIQRSTSVRTMASKVSPLNTTASRRTIVEDADIEKAIDELAGAKATSRRVSIKKDSSAVCVPVATRYPTPRQDVRRDLSRVYGRTYDDDLSSRADRRHTLKFSRAHSDRHLGTLSTELVRDYRRSQSFLQGFGRSAWRYPRRPNQTRYYQSSRDQGEDYEASPAGGVFPGHFSPPNLSRRDSDEASLRLPPRSHSRQTANIRDNQHSH